MRVFRNEQNFDWFLNESMGLNHWLGGGRKVSWEVFWCNECFKEEWNSFLNYFFGIENWSGIAWWYVGRLQWMNEAWVYEWFLKTGGQIKDGWGKWNVQENNIINGLNWVIIVLGLKSY